MGNTTGSLLSGQGPWLLGVLWGYTEATAVKYNHLQVFQTGLAAVVPVPRLVELLTSEPVAAVHREAEAHWRETHRTS